MPLPRLVVTGASGFIGRRLLDAMKEQFEIVGMARRSQARCGAPVHRNITWFQVDIGDRDALSRVFRAVREAGGADFVIHLAAHYDFTGVKDPEYWRTNVDGLRNVLEECKDLGLRGFVFASSVAACDFPRAGDALDESSPPDGDHIYAITKGIGEQMLAGYDGKIKSCIVRFAAMFSDWCEYPPLYFFLETWVSEAWNSRVLGGRGVSAIPYLHVRDVPRLMVQILDRFDRLKQREVVIASPSATLCHRELFDLTNLNFRGQRRKPILLPRLLCRVGVNLRDVIGRVLGNRHFERPWMMDYIDKDLAVDARRTCNRLGWKPRERLLLNRRIPFMVEHLKRDPVEWQRRNLAAFKEVRLRSNLRIYRLFEKHHEEIRETFVAALTRPEVKGKFAHYQNLPAEILSWRYVVVLRHLMNAVRTGDKGVFTDYCRDLATRRYEEGFSPFEVCGALQVLKGICLEKLHRDFDAADLGPAIHDHVAMTLEFGCDQVLETFEDLGADLASIEET